MRRRADRAFAQSLTAFGGAPAHKGAKRARRSRAGGIAGTPPQSASPTAGSSPQSASLTAPLWKGGQGEGMAQPPFGKGARDGAPYNKNPPAKRGVFQFRA